MINKKVLKLVNDERRSVNVLSAKGCSAGNADTPCSGATDICPYFDASNCSTYAYDYCSVKDLYSCSGYSSDLCNTDTTECAYEVSDVDPATRY